MSNPISEMIRYLAGWENLARAKRWYNELLGIDAAKEVMADVITHERKVESVAHKAETYDREALAAIDAAMKPESDGGESITPAEAKKIRRLVSLSAENDHDASELAHV